MQASVRLSDRVVIQVGTSLGVRDGCEIVELSSQQEADLRAAFGQPHGNVYIAADGTVSFDPYVAPPPPPPPPDQAQFDAAVTKLRSTFGTARTVGDVNLCLDAVTVILRRFYQELQ